MSEQQFEKVADISEVPKGKMKISRLSNGIEIFVANVEGQFFALPNRCTHQGGPLGKGRLNGSVVQCPWHGSKFDVRTGEIIQGPAKNTEPVFELRVENNSIWVKKKA